MPDDVVADRPMKLRYAGVCRLCGQVLPTRTDAIHGQSSRSVRCVECPAAAALDAGVGVEAQAAEASPDDAGVAGSCVALIVLASGTSTKVKAGSVLPEALNFLEELRQHHPGARGGR